MKKTKLPRDPNQRAKNIVDIASGKVKVESDNKNAMSVAYGRLGGLKGGVARANKLTPEQRSEIAKNAAKKRWDK